MVVIANAIGEISCAAIGNFVDQCHTGQSVAAVGYGVAALFLFVFIVSKAIGPPVEH
jgi:hypothetical protein